MGFLIYLAKATTQHDINQPAVCSVRVIILLPSQTSQDASLQTRFIKEQFFLRGIIIHVCLYTRQAHTVNQSFLFLMDG